MATAAAVLIRREKDIVELYRRAGATAPGTALTPATLDIHHRVAFDILVRRAVLRDVGSGRYYLDEFAWQALRARRHRLAGTMMVLIIVAFVALVATGVVTLGFGIPKLH
ncbi:MAG TPA: hypothetical protein VGM67_03235 [Gemmatimonadaceae bacterium]|jgi:hypothetical protein